MNIRPIRTEADYREALSMVDSLWTSATPDTPEGDQLDILVTLIQVYEREHYPIPPPDPIEAIKFRIEHAVPTSALDRSDTADRKASGLRTFLPRGGHGYRS